MLDCAQRISDRSQKRSDVGKKYRTHSVHAAHLRPDLDKDTNMSAVKHVRLQKLKEGDVGILALELAHLLDLLVLADNKGRIRIALPVNQGKNRETLLPTILASQPTGRLGQNHQAKEQQYSRNHLQAPWDAEGCSAIYEAASVGNAVMWPWNISKNPRNYAFCIVILVE